MTRHLHLGYLIHRMRSYIAIRVHNNDLSYEHWNRVLSIIKIATCTPRDNSSWIGNHWALVHSSTHLTIYDLLQQNLFSLNTTCKGSMSCETNSVIFNLQSLKKYLLFLNIFLNLAFCILQWKPNLHQI